jgi:hypothetical protein
MTELQRSRTVSLVFMVIPLLPLSFGRGMTIRCNTVSRLYPGDDKDPPK